MASEIQEKMKYHLIGIGGIGMSGIARILHQMQYQVTGSDIKDGETIDQLKNLGIPVFLNHDAKNIPYDAQVVYSTDISCANVEFSYAKKNGIPTLHRSDLLHRLMKDQKPLLVAGTHGKTTTSSLLISALLQAEVNPSYATGGILLESNVNAAKGNGEYFVAEADESDGSFLKYHPYGAIITNVDNDHLNHYKTEENIIAAFKKFGMGVISKKHLFFCNENASLKNCNLEGISYGFNQEADLRGLNFRQEGWKIFFDVEFEGISYQSIEVGLTGYHNALNALAVFGMTIRLGLNEDKVRFALKNFKGAKRRLEFKGEMHQVHIRDDYGHHPTEIKATLSAVKNAFPSLRLVVLFQPHRYSRTLECINQFGNCFEDADLVFVTDIYSAGEKPIEGISQQSIVEEIKKKSSVQAFGVSRNDLIEEALRHIKRFDMVLTMGAGDIGKEGEKLLEKLKQQNLKKLKVGLVYGGKSEEHEISVSSACHISKELDADIFDVSFFYISKEGKWSLLKQFEEKLARSDLMPVLSADVLNELYFCDIIFPVLHGPYGEDGTLQGFFDMLNIPYAGCNHQSSSVCMDKAVTKKLAAALGLKVAPFIDFSVYQWKLNQVNLLEKIQESLNFPLFVKPVHLGSTIGVRKVTTNQQLADAILHVFEYDYHVLIEEEIVGRECEFAIFGNQKITVFPPGEIFNDGEIYDYDAKYGQNAFKTISKAHLDRDLINSGMDFALKAYESVGCDGFARVDCFLDENNHFILNEINPIPGFTENSLYPKMCVDNGLLLKDLLTELICLGLSRQRLKERLKNG